MGSADEGWSHDQGSAEISVELNEVALETLASGDPCLMPCVDCGLVTNKFCDLCWGEDHFPQDKWAHGRLIPLCSRCDLMYLQCHFCRGEDWCVPAAHWYRAIQTSYKYLPLSVLQAQGYTSDDIVKIVKNCDKRWDTCLEEDTFRVTTSSSFHSDVETA